MPVKSDRVFGKLPPKSYVRIRVEEVQGGKILSTQSYAVHGYSHKRVVTLVEGSLTHAFAETPAPEEEDTPVEPKKKVVVRRARI